MVGDCLHVCVCAHRVAGYGGNSSSVTSQLVNVTAIYTAQAAFAALRKDGTVITWGFASKSRVLYNPFECLT